MPTRTDRDAPRYDASVQARVKNVFDRDPLVIPQLFVDARAPWYRRGSAVVGAVLLVLVVAALAVLLYRYGLAGTALRLGRVGAGVMRGFAQIVAG